LFYKPHLKLGGAWNEATSTMTFIHTCGFLDCQIDGHWLEGTYQSHPNQHPCSNVIYVPHCSLIIDIIEKLLDDTE